MKADCFGSFRNSSVCFGCFDTGSKHRNKPKKNFFWFHQTNRNKRKTDLVSVCFGSNRNFFFFHFEDTLGQSIYMVGIHVQVIMYRERGGRDIIWGTYGEYLFTESVATLPPFGPIEGQKWFDRISSQ